MAININAKTTGVGGLETSADNSGEINIQSGGSTVMNVTSSGVSVTGSFSQNGAVYSTQPSFRNLIINGDMRIAQRGTSATGLTTTGYYTLDRWHFYAPSSPTYAFTMTQDTDVPTGQGFSSSVKLDCTTAQTPLATNSQLILRHMIEGQNLQQLAFGTANAKSLTFSFWVKSNKTGTYITNLYQASGTRTISKSYTIDTADTWEKKTITFEGDTSGAINNNNGIGLYVMFHLAMGSNFQSGTLSTSWASYTAPNYSVGQVNLADSTSNYINITGVQLEVGEGASDFEFLPYDVQLQRCYRYYQVLDGTGANYAFYGSGAYISTTSCRGSLQVENIFRALPTATFNGAFRIRSDTDRTVTSITLMSSSGATRSTLGFNATTSSATQGYAGYFSANADNATSIEFDAEL